ncbi:hypothetical protein [Marinitenerispora sediminis]|uniref:Uncharacterized protein n=1 Tax=Marinitenerispora sediminis TaxID=1931232 RepID=A0A368TC50_9ACTN|nr:hypothetical protein [Marinitenerispora sediminis]RCV58150.1 hypothetical protein DEF28_00315 [Marinitenerispora sediminis]RCV61441.1 hypothetical protein DEF23_02130 [Marinitenerispora sediminis]RCV62521.1 hypothetical protein DEF24_00665 [Marinitenerispora sediminis]
MTWTNGGSEPFFGRLFGVEREKEVKAPFTARLRSGTEGLYFTARFNLRLLPAAENGRSRAKLVNDAQQAARAAAEQVSVGYSIVDSGNAQLAVNERLLSLRSPAVSAASWATADISAHEADIERAREIEAANHRAVIELRQQEDMVRQIRHLRDGVFRDGDLARLWWLMKYPEHVERLPQVGQALDGIGSGQPTTTAESEVARVVELCFALVAGLADDSRKLLARQSIDFLAHVFTACDRPDLVSRLPGMAGAEPAVPG